MMANIKFCFSNLDLIYSNITIIYRDLCVKRKFVGDDLKAGCCSDISSDLKNLIPELKKFLHVFKVLSDLSVLKC